MTAEQINEAKELANGWKHVAGGGKDNATHDGRRIRRTVDGIVGNQNGGE